MNLDDCYKEGLLKRVRPQPEVAEREIERAKKYLEDAKKTHKMGIYNITVVAAYTSMFHAARAILFKDGIRERSHVCIVIYIRHKYPKLAEQARVLDTYRRFRHTALYALDVNINKEEAEKSIKLADEFIGEIGKML